MQIFLSFDRLIGGPHTPRTHFGYMHVSVIA